MNIVLKAFSDFLGLQYPVEITVKSRLHKKMDGYHIPIYSDKTGNLKYHKIVIYTTDISRPFYTILAHELIHAWQEENSKRDEFHGKQFQKMASKMCDRFDLTQIYMQEYDK